MANAIPFRKELADPRFDFDAEVVERIRRGDSAAFESLYRAHYAGLWRFARASTGSAELAEEIVQDVFLALWRRRAEWSVRNGVAVYLYGAVRNRILNAGRNARSGERQLLELTHESAVTPVAIAALPGPEESLDAKELRRVVDRAVAALPEKQRTALRLRWAEELTHAAIGGVLGMTEEGARLLVHRAELAVRSAVQRTL